jgi:hypothetical protein
MQSKLTKRQTKTYGPKTYTEDGTKYRITATVRYDDQCGNGHNSFSITGDVDELCGKRWREYMGGCIHEEIKKHFPKLAPFIKWHLVSSDGPMHYTANTIYHARDTDCDGLLAGQYSAYVIKIIGDTLKNESNTVLYTSGTMYTNKQNNPNLAKSNDKEQAKIDEFLAAVKPELNPRTIKENCAFSLSKGKPHDLGAARRCAVWPDATLEQLRDKDALEARLPALMGEFKRDVESLGLEF